MRLAQPGVALLPLEPAAAGVPGPPFDKALVGAWGFAPLRSPGLCPERRAGGLRTDRDLALEERRAPLRGVGAGVVRLRDGGALAGRQDAAVPQARLAAVERDRIDGVGLE